IDEMGFARRPHAPLTRDRASRTTAATLAGEALEAGKAEEGAEGATAPETLRQKDREGLMNAGKFLRRLRALADAEGAEDGHTDGRAEISQAKGQRGRDAFGSIPLRGRLGAAPDRQPKAP